MKKSIILIISLILSISWAHAFEKDGIHYTIIDGEAVVINPALDDEQVGGDWFEGTYIEKASTYTGEINIPSVVTYEGKAYTVTGIGREAFLRCDESVSVKIPETVKRIGMCAFSYSYISSLTIPNSVEKIGWCACCEMFNLREIVFPEKLDTIPDRMLQFSQIHGWKSPLVSVKMPKEVKYIDRGAFAGLTNLEYISLPEGLKYIGEGAFTGNNKMVAELPASVSYIGANAFHITKAPTNTSLPDSLRTLEPEAFRAAKGLTQMSIPGYITNIPDYCFAACSNITSLELNDNIENIGKFAFNWLRALKIVILPASLKSIGKYAFSQCLNLRTVYALMKTPCTLGDYAFGGGETDYPNPSDATLYVPTGCKSAYEAAGWGKYFAQIIEMEETEQKAAFAKALTGISTVKADDGVKPSGWYDLQGRRLTEPRKGVNIIRYNDGTARKVLK